MAPITKHGYRSEQDKLELRALYSSAGWKRVRLAVLARDGGMCRWCRTTDPPIDVVHLGGRTLEILRRQGIAGALDPLRLAAGCRRCHARFAAGLLGKPRPESR